MLCTHLVMALHEAIFSVNVGCLFARGTHHWHVCWRALEDGQRLSTSVLARLWVILGCGRLCVEWEGSMSTKQVAWLPLVSMCLVLCALRYIHYLRVDRS